MTDEIVQLIDYPYLKNGVWKTRVNNMYVLSKNLSNKQSNNKNWLRTSDPEAKSYFAYNGYRFEVLIIKPVNENVWCFISNMCEISWDTNSVMIMMTTI